MRQSGIGLVTVVGLGLGTWAVLMALNLLFPEPMTTVTNVVGPVLMLGASIGFILGLAVLWNDYWARRSRRQ